MKFLFDLDYVAFRVATRYLKRNGIYDDIVHLQNEHKSTGVSLIDFAALYEYVKRYRPQYVLECGSGLSTHILARAMKKYSMPVYDEIRLVSMESESNWHQEAINRFSFKDFDFVDICLSEIVNYRYSFVTGMIYKDIPIFPYDFVFVDGPNYQDQCDMDFIKIVESSNKTVSALVDSRRTSVLAYSALLGSNKIDYYSFGFSHIHRIKSDDLLLTDKASLHKVFDANIKMKRGMYIRGLISSMMLCLFPMRIFD